MISLSGPWSQTFHITGIVIIVIIVMSFVIIVVIVPRGKWKYLLDAGCMLDLCRFFSQCVDSLWGSSGACMLASWWAMDTGTGGEGVMIHISVSATGIWVWDCPLVVGAGLVPFSGGDSPLTVGLSMGSWGSGATDTRVLAWFSSSTWKDSAWGEHRVKHGNNEENGNWKLICFCRCCSKINKCVLC